METTVAKPIEDVIQGLDGIVAVRSQSTNSTTRHHRRIRLGR